MSDLACEPRVVEAMLGAGRRLAEVEEYIEASPLENLDKAALWMLAWAHQDHRVQLRLANEMLALASTLSASRREPGRNHGRVAASERATAAGAVRSVQRTAERGRSCPSGREVSAV